MPQPLSLKIGPSGVRGVIGESLTPQLVTSFAAAFGTYCGAGPILVGTDTRPSGEMLKQAAIAGLLSVGCTPVDVGIVPVPALMLHVREAGAFGGIAVGGSHGSLEWNALRFIGSEGLALRANQAAELTDLYHQGVFPRVRALEMSEVRADTTSIARHLRAITRTVDVERIRAQRFKVAVDPGGATAPAPTLRLLEALGCDVVAVDAGAERSYRDTRSRTRRAWPNWATSCVARARPSASPRTRTPIGSRRRRARRPARPGRDRCPRRPALARAQAGARRRQRLDEPHGGRRGGPLRVPRPPFPRRRGARDRGDEGPRGGGGRRRATAA